MIHFTDSTVTNIIIMILILFAILMMYTIFEALASFLNAFCLSGFSAPFTFIGFLPENKK